ncbi:MAG: copper resistance protein CopC [Rhodopila sp.]|nr:copper resistance protein CopC [Rhodopila sp.]
MFSLQQLFRIVDRALVAALLLALSWPGATAAHAVLKDHFPATDASLSVAPSEVRLVFNEMVTPVVARVLDAGGHPVSDADAVFETDTTVHVRLPPALVPGSYVVSYRVISADSHPVGGSFVFAFGVAAPDGGLAQRLGGASDSQAWPMIAAILRAAFYGTFLIAAGGGLFLAFIDRRPTAAHADRGLVLGTSLAAALLLVLLVGIEGGFAAGVSLAGLLDPAVWRVGMHTTLGSSAIITIAGVAMLAVGVVRGEQPVVVGGTVLALAGFALTGHVATAQPRWLTVPALIVHVGLAAFWVGALVPLYRRLGAETAAVAAPIVARFAGLALMLVPCLIAAGLTIATIQVGTPAALTGTAYGRRLLTKLGLVAALLSFAALNKTRLTPRLGGGDAGAARLLRAAIGAEIALVAGVLAATASLGQVTPPRALAEAAHPAADIAISARAGSRTALIKVVPGRRGDNRLAVTLLNPDGTPAAARGVSVWLSNPDLGIEASEREMTREAAGRFVIERLPLPIAGNWTVEIDALVTDFDQWVFTATVPVP